MAGMQPRFESTDPSTPTASRMSGIAAVCATAPVPGREVSRGLAAAWVFAAGLTGVFLCRISPFNVEEGGAVLVGRLAYLAWALALGGGYAFATLNHCALWQNPKTRWWVAAYAGVLSVMLCRSILNWEYQAPGRLTIYIQQCLTFVAPLVLIPCGGLMLRSKPFQMTVALHAAIGGLVGLALILGNGLSTRADYQTADDLPRGDLGLNFESGNPFYAIPMALLLLPHLRKLLALSVVRLAGWFI